MVAVIDDASETFVVERACPAARMAGRLVKRDVYTRQGSACGAGKAGNTGAYDVYSGHSDVSVMSIVDDEGGELVMG